MTPEGQPLALVKPRRFQSVQSLLGLVAALIVVFVGFSTQVPTFASLSTVELIARQSVVTILVSLGMTLVIIVGGIDLSVGSIAALAGVVVAKVVGDTAHPGSAPLVGALAGVGAGLLCGLLNGLLITRLRVVPFIVTLGTFLSMRGAAKWIGNDQKVDARDTWLNSILSSLGSGERWKLLPYGVWFTVAMGVLMAFVLRNLRFGRHVVAVGSNEAAARLCGVPVERVKLGVYALSGLFAGLAGLMNFSRLTVGDPTALVGLELDAIAAVVIGGASLSGGEGSIAGSILGALIISVLRAGAGQMGLPNSVQEIVTGGIIILAVWLDRVRKARALKAG